MIHGDDPLAATPVEDRGTQTATWYAFQYAVTAGDCTALLTGEIAALIVEWHTDYVTIAPNGLRTLVSVKHREQEQGPWRLSELCNRGGLATLHERWRSAGEGTASRWITNAALQPGTQGARELQQCLESETLAGDAQLTDLAAHYVAHFARALAISETETRQFLSALRLVSIGADSRTIGMYVRDRMCRPALTMLGMAKAQGDRLYQTIERAVTEAAQALPDEEPATWESLERSTRSTRDHRTLTRARLAARLSSAGVTLTSGPARSTQTVMARKLLAGNLGPSTRSNAMKLRRDWYEVEASFREDLPAAFVEEVEHVRSEVQAAAELAEAQVRQRGRNPYGVTMHAHLRTAAAGIAASAALPITSDHVLGCAYQLTDECKIWWSDEFDTNTDAPWVRGAGNVGG